MTLDDAKREALAMLRDAQIVLTEQEQESMEVADLGLGNVEEIGLQIVVYVNTERYCAKELVMMPRQTFPEHTHPDLGDVSGKMETFRCRKGVVYLYVPGPPTTDIQAIIPVGSENVFTARHEIVLRPGDQYTLQPNTAHWFQAGDEGAIVSEFSSRSRDQFDIFTDTTIVRDFQDEK
jgi:D-lyxose ketol-isomerase